MLVKWLAERALNSSLSKLAKPSISEDMGFLAHSRDTARNSVLGLAKIFSAMYLSFFLFDMILLPHLWKNFFLVRLLVVVPALFYVRLVERKILPFNLLSKLIVFVPVTWANAYGVIQVPREMFAAEASLGVLLILPTAVVTPWPRKEFVWYSILVALGSALFWLSSSTLTLDDLTLLYTITGVGLVVGLMLVKIRTGIDLNRFLSEKQLLQQELTKVEAVRQDIQARVLDAENYAFLAQHLEAFLADINNIIMMSELVVSSDIHEPKDYGKVLEPFQVACGQAIGRIKSFLSMAMGDRSSQQSLVVGAELAAILPLVQLEINKSNFIFNYFVDSAVDDITVDSGTEKVSVVVFKLTRFAIDSLRRAKEGYPGPTFVGTIKLDVVTGPGAVLVTLEDNGIGISAEQLTDFEVLGFSQVTANETTSGDAPARTISRRPRLGGGSVVILKLPILDPLNCSISVLPRGRRHLNF